MTSYLFVIFGLICVVLLMIILIIIASIVRSGKVVEQPIQYDLFIR